MRDANKYWSISNLAGNQPFFYLTFAFLFILKQHIFILLIYEMQE